MLIHGAPSLLASLSRSKWRAGTNADYFINQTAEQQDASIISDDRYRDYADEFPAANARRIPFMIVKSQVQLYEDRLPAHGNHNG